MHFPTSCHDQEHKNEARSNCDSRMCGRYQCLRGARSRRCDSAAPLFCCGWQAGGAAAPGSIVRPATGRRRDPRALALEGTRAADVDFPLGLPLLAGQDTVIPLDINVSFSDLPGLADVAVRLATRSSVNYQLDGTVAVNAGPLGTPRFGPSTLLNGTLSIRR
jgi:hypothetical protein